MILTRKMSQGIDRIIEWPFMRIFDAAEPP